MPTDPARRAPNKALLQNTLAAIKAEPVHWNQTSYAVKVAHREYEGPAEPVAPCGTAYCFAGWAVGLSGHWVRPGNLYVPMSHLRRVSGLTMEEQCEEIGYELRGPIVNPELYVEDAAIIILGLAGHTVPFERGVHSAHLALFHPQNTLDDLEHVITLITAGMED